VQALIAAGADVNTSDELGRPALLVAAGESGNPSVVRALLAAGARVNAKGKDGDTALTAAVREYLPGEDEFIKNALHRNTEVVRALLDAGADPCVRGKDGRSAVKLAGESGNKILIGMLEGAARR
jgi:ankyrin repeat protein